MSKAYRTLQSALLTGDYFEYRGLRIYPVQVKDYPLFASLSACLTVDKNIIPDMNIIRMTNLEYLFYTAEKDETPYLFYFDRLLAMVLRDDDSFDEVTESVKRYRYDEHKKPFFNIGSDTFGATDFEKLRDIICEQNLLELPDDNVQKEVRDSLEEARKYKEKLNGSKPGSLEDYVIAIAISTGWTFEYIYELPIRKFIKSLERLDNLLHYKIYLGASLSGMVEFKDKSFIKHWLVDLNSTDKFKDVKVDVADIEQKIRI